jgi:hypothetical protein
MKIQDVLTPSFRQLHHQLGHDRTGCQHAMWQQRLSSDSDFCRAVVANGYLSRQQMQHAAQRYLLGRSRDGGVIFWQMVSTEQVFDGKIMYYRTDCHRDHERHPQWVSNLLKRHYLQQCPQLASYMPTFCHCLFDIPEKFNFILHILHIYHKLSVHRPLRSERCVRDV